MPADWLARILLAVSAASAIGTLLWLGYVVSTFHCLGAEQDPREQEKARDDGHHPANGHGELVMSDAPRTEPHATDDQNEFDNQHRLAEQRYWERQICVAQWMNGLTALAAVAALGGFWVLQSTLLATRDAATAAADSARATFESNQLSRDHFRAAKRPWVILKEFSVRRGRSEGNPVQFVLTFINTGEGQALRLKAVGKSRTAKPSLGNTRRPWDGIPPPLDNWPPFNFPERERPIL